MGYFRQYPYSNFHEMNMDEILKIIRQMLDDWAAFQLEMGEYVHDVDEALLEFRNWFNNLDIEDELRDAVNAAVDEMITSGEMGSLIAPYIPTIVQQWMDDNITNPTTPVIDKTLLTGGAAADARAAGQIRKQLYGLYNELSFTTQVGYVDNNTGAFVDNYANWSRSGYIAVDASIDLYIYSQYATNYNAIYDSNHTFISAFSINAGYATAVQLPINAAYIAISGLDPSLDDLYMFQYKVRKYNGIASGVFEPYDNLINKVKWYNGTLTSAGVYNFSTARLVTDFIPVNGNQLIYGDVFDYGIIIAEYDTNKSLLYIQNFYYDAPGFLRMLRPETKYIRMCVVYSPDTSRTLYPYNIYESHLLVHLQDVIDSPIKVMTYNAGGYAYGLDYGLAPAIYDEKLTNYRRVIAEVDADIIGMQEYDTRMDRANTIWANDVLWDYYYANEEVTGSQTAIKSKIPMQYHYSAQLTSGRYYSYGFISGVFIMSVHFSVGAGNATTRAAEAAEVISIVSQYSRYIIFGDFNPMPGEESTLYGLFTAAGMNVANCGWFGKYYTWTDRPADFDDYDNPQGTVWYVDNIITSSNIKIENAYPLPEAYDLLASDHIPFVAELSIS